jgi:hypothetical protein
MGKQKRLKPEHGLSLFLYSLLLSFTMASGVAVGLDVS